MTIPITAAKERMETRQPHTKRIMSVISFFMSHKPTNHAKRLPPYRLQQKIERTSRTDQPNHLCSGRLFLTLFPLCISLAVFIITTFFLCISELIRLISCASKGRALGKTRFFGKSHFNKVNFITKSFEPRSKVVAGLSFYLCWQNIKTKES